MTLYPTEQIWRRFFTWTLGELSRNLVCDWRERARSGNFHKGDRLITLFTGEICSLKASLLLKMRTFIDEVKHCKITQASYLRSLTKKNINKVIKEHNCWISEVGIFNNGQTGGRSEQVEFVRELVVLVYNNNNNNTLFTFPLQGLSNLLNN